MGKAEKTSSQWPQRTLGFYHRLSRRNAGSLRKRVHREIHAYKRAEHDHDQGNELHRKVSFTAAETLTSKAILIIN